MRVIWIVLIAFAFAFFSQGNSLPSRNPKEADISPVFPSESIILPLEGTTDDFTGPGLYASDKKPNSPTRGTQNGNLNSKVDTFTSSELKKLFANVIIGKHLSKKVTRLLKSRPGLLERSNKDLKNVIHHLPKGRHAHGTTMDSNMQYYPGMDDQVMTGSPVLKRTGSASEQNSEYDDQQILPVANLRHRKVKKQSYHIKELSSDEAPETEWSSSELQDMEPETDEVLPSNTEWESSETQDTESGSGKDELSPEDNAPNSGALEDKEPDSAEIKQSSSETLNEPETKDSEWDSGASVDMEPHSDDIEWDSGATQDTVAELEKDKLSPEDNEWDSGALENIEQYSTEIERGSSETQAMEPESEKGEFSPEDNGWDYSALKNMEPDSTDIEWGFGGTQDLEPASEKNELSPEDNDWDSDAPVDVERDSADDNWGSEGAQELESGKDELSLEYSEWDSDLGTKMEPDLTDNEWGSGETQDIEPASEKDNPPSEDNEWDSGAPVDMEADSGEDEWGSGEAQYTEFGSVKDAPPSRSNEWDSGAPVDMEPDSADEWGSRAAQDTEPGSEKDAPPSGRNEWDSVAPVDMEADSADDERDSDGAQDTEPGLERDGSPSGGNEWDSGAPVDMEPDSVDDEWGSCEAQDTEPGSEKDDSPSEDNEWDSGASVNMKPDSADDEWGSGDARYRKSGSGKDDPPSGGIEWDSGAIAYMEPHSADDEWGSFGAQYTEPVSQKDEISLEDNEFNSMMEPDSADTEWGSGGAQDTGLESVTHNSKWDSGVPVDMEPDSDDIEWGSSETQDTGPESEKPSPDHIKRDSDAPEVMDSDFEHNALSQSRNEPPGVPESKELRSLSSKKSSEVERDSVASANINKVREQLSNEKKKETLPLNEPNKEDIIVMTQLPHTGNELGAGKEKGSQRKIPTKKTKVVFSSVSLGNGLSDGRNHHVNVNIHLDPNLSYKRGVSTKTEKKTKSGKENSGAVVSVLVTLFVFGGLLVVLLMIAFFVFAWPIRKYYEKLSMQIDNSDVESGQRADCELTSIRVDRSYPPADQPAPSYPPQLQKPPSACYQTPVAVTRQATSGSGRNAVVTDVQDVQPSQLASEVPQTTNQAKAGSNKKKIRTKVDVITDDKNRDSRNVERRRIIKQQTSQRRGSLADSIMLAKSVIDGHSKHEKFEKKASERRRVIKHCTSAPGNKRRLMSFSDQLQTGCSVITPNVDHTKSLVRSKERCRKIKDRCTGKRRNTLAEEIGVAKEVIVDNERKYEKSPVVSKQVIVEHAPHTDCKSLSDSDITDLKFRNDQAKKSNTSSSLQSHDDDMEEFRRGFTRFVFDSDEEANWNLI